MLSVQMKFEMNKNYHHIIILHKIYVFLNKNVISSILIKLITRELISLSNLHQKRLFAYNFDRKLIYKMTINYNLSHI